MSKRTHNIWVLLEHRDGAMEDVSYGLAAEAASLRSQLEGSAHITAVAAGRISEEELSGLGGFGIDTVLLVEHDDSASFHAGMLARELAALSKEDIPSFIFMAQGYRSADCAPQLGALLGGAVVTQAMDFKVQEDGSAHAVRPIENGYLFEEISITGPGPFIVCFVPSVLGSHDSPSGKEAQIKRVPFHVSEDALIPRIVDIEEADPGALEIDEADIVVAGGRGAGGTEEEFTLIHELAELLSGPVAGTRPVIDSRILPLERQIGQTGKTVTPRLLVACGISGANEFTAGMEKARRVVAINTDPFARIFKFADLGLVGDVRKVVPRVIALLRKRGGTNG